MATLVEHKLWLSSTKVHLPKMGMCLLGIANIKRGGI